MEDQRPTDHGHKTRPPKPAQKLSRPDDASLREAVELVQQAYGDDLRKDAATAVATLLKAVPDTTDAARRYALLSVAERVAIDAGDAALAMTVVGRRTDAFDEDVMRARHGVFLKLKKSVKKFDSGLFTLAVTIADEAAAAEAYDLADGAADIALDIAMTIDRDEKRAIADYRRTRFPPQKQPPPPEATARALIADAKQLQKVLQDQRRETSEFNEAEKRLLANPSDADAARRVGEYLCFTKRDWSRGLKHLVRAGTDQVRDLAGQELAIPDASGATSGARFRLAGGWWRLAESGGLPPAQAASVRQHAAEIYADVITHLSDPTEKALARKRSGRDPDPPAGDAVKSDPQPPERRPR